MSLQLTEINAESLAGPGVKPVLPKANADFWTGSGHPTSMWEATLCPVTDVAAFLSDPLRCIFGDGGGTIISKSNVSSL